jgi:hypothetical protein
MNIEIERDATSNAWQITDFEGKESQVIYYQAHGIPQNPLYETGMENRQFITVSVMDLDNRVNRLWISDELLKELVKRS